MALRKSTISRIQNQFKIVSPVIAGMLYSFSSTLKLPEKEVFRIFECHGLYRDDIEPNPLPELYNMMVEELEKMSSARLPFYYHPMLGNSMRFRERRYFGGDLRERLQAELSL